MELYDDYAGQSAAVDTTPPTLSNPADGTPTSDGATGASVDTNEANGTLYWAVVTNGGSCTDAQLKAGSGGNIVAGVAGNQAVSGTGTQVIATITGLTASTLYQIKYLQRDAAGNDSPQASVSLTTAAAGDPPVRVWSDWDAQSGSGTTMVYTSTGNTITAGRVVEGVVGWGDDVTLVSVVDDKGNNYTVVDTLDSGARHAASFYKANASGGADPQFTITFSAAASDRTLGFRELSGAATSSPLVANDANAQVAPGTGTDAITSTAQTPSANNAFISGWTIPFLLDSVVVQGTGFTLDSGIGSPAGTRIAAESLEQGAAASVAATFTTSADGGDTFLTFMMAFKP